jgi:hypothetical protein
MEPAKNILRRIDTRKLYKQVSMGGWACGFCMRVRAYVSV